jgi:simple sugar transport system substrate-binding protein
MLNLKRLGVVACLFALCVARAEEPLRLIFVTVAVEAKFFEPVKQGMNDAAEMLNVECTFTGTEGVDVEAQVEMVRQAVKDGYDGIALNIIDPVAFDEVVQEAIDAGVPVVAFNVDDHATPNARLSAVNQHLYEAGRSLAEHVAPSIPEKARVLYTMHDEGVSALEDRLRGIQDVLKEKGVTGCTVISGNDSKKGAEVIADALKEEDGVTIVLGTGQSDSEAAGRAIEQHFKDKGYWSAGFDLSPTTLRLIQDDVIKCTVDQQPYIQGFYPVVQLTHYLRYGIVPSDIDAGAAIIDKNNAAEVEELTERKLR